MGYYTKHIFKIVGEHTTDDLVKLATAIYKASGYAFAVYPDIDCIDDRRWNTPFGAKLYYLADNMKETSKLVPEIEFTVDCNGEEGEEYTLHCFNGEIETINHTTWDDKNEYHKKIDDYPDINYDISFGELPNNVINIDE